MAAMERDDIIWLTGLFEGEGSVGIKEGKYPRVTIAMSDEDVVRRCLTITGMGAVYVKYKDHPSGRKDMWSWQVHKRHDVARLLCAMAPLLGERRRIQVMKAADALYEGLRRPGRRNPAKCGTPAGYKFHLRKSEPTCRLCKDAVAADRMRFKKAA